MGPGTQWRTYRDNVEMGQIPFCSSCGFATQATSCLGHPRLARPGWLRHRAWKLRLRYTVLWPMPRIVTIRLFFFASCFLSFWISFRPSLPYALELRVRKCGRVKNESRRGGTQWRRWSSLMLMVFPGHLYRHGDDTIDFPEKMTCRCVFRS
jgi:hypothetical protein